MTSAAYADIVEVIDYTGKSYYVNTDHIVEIHEQQNGAAGMFMYINLGDGVNPIWITQAELDSLIQGRVISRN